LFTDPRHQHVSPVSRGFGQGQPSSSQAKTASVAPLDLVESPCILVSLNQQLSLSRALVLADRRWSSFRPTAVSPRLSASHAQRELCPSSPGWRSVGPPSLPPWMTSGGACRADPPHMPIRSRMPVVLCIPALHLHMYTKSSETEASAYGSFFLVVKRRQSRRWMARTDRTETTAAAANRHHTSYWPAPPPRGGGGLPFRVPSWLLRSTIL
jgi:hypothetical protein